MQPDESLGTGGYSPPRVEDIDTADDEFAVNPAIESPSEF